MGGQLLTHHGILVEYNSHLTHRHSICVKRLIGIRKDVQTPREELHVTLFVKV